MLFRNVEPAIIAEAAARVGAVLYSQSADTRRLTLRPSATCKYRRVSAGFGRQGRRVNAVCWHGHREFFRALFALAPEAVVSTALARYTAENFESAYPSTDRNIGPMVASMFHSEACSCPEGMFSE